MVKADIYLDVDGVLFALNKEDGLIELRDGFMSFLKFLTDNFENVYWLTCWHDGFNQILKQIYAGDIASKIKAVKWCGNKALAIDFERNFAWIEDGISDEETNVLIEHGCIDNYIEVPFYGEMHILYDIKQRLKVRFNIP